MTRQQRELLQRILASRKFAHAESLRKILQYLCSHSGRSLKEYEIAVDALGRGADFDPKTDPIVRVSIGAIRGRLESYFKEEGAREALRLTIPKGRYEAVFSPAPPAERQASPARDALFRFWAPYLESGRSVVIVCSELLFFRDEHCNYFRNIYVNDMEEGAAALASRIPGLEASALRPSYHFMSAGEVHCLIALQRLFAEFGARADMANSRFCTWHDLRDANVILIGSSRVNRFVAAMQEEECFQVKPDRIVNRCPRPGERSYYEGARSFEGKLERLTEYGLVTRKSGIAPGACVTMLSGNHGRVMEALGIFLTMEDRVADLLSRMHLSGGEPFPAHAQVLFQVEMIDFDEEVVSTEYLAHRVLCEPAVPQV
jgi:hypothetical protein